MCSSSIELEYHFYEGFNALIDRLNWNNPEGDCYPFDLSKPLPLQGHPGHLTVVTDYFFNNDLEYLKSSDPERMYATSITKTKSAQHEIEWIEYMVHTLWSPTKVGYKSYTTLPIQPSNTQIEPKRDAKALTGPAWVEVMQEELLQSKLQKVRRSFLKTGWALIDVYEGELTLHVGNKAVTLNLNQTSRYSSNYDVILVNQIYVINVACEEYSQEVLGFFMSGNPTPSTKLIVSTSSPTLTLFGDSDFLLEETDAFLAIEDEPISPKINDSYYVQRETFFFLKNFLMMIHHHHISLYKNLNPWVSPVHCVPKKGGFTVGENEENELIPTRLVTGWSLCIDYRKLNDATRKDHFPLPFMDQMLERLAGNEYYCFLDGFSGYFQIPIDPQDQEKTTFMSPYGTFAYRHMPFGLCNAPGTFQRCMTAIFHDMIEKKMEVFMDDFSEKIHFMVKEGIVLGHKISRNGIEVDKAKVDVIAKLPHLTTVKGDRSFLGHSDFYR
nr:reverse transcriptase domain-containing protein [Tanacetum cinerariifolium]